MSAHVPYGLGLTIRAPAASGCCSHAACTCSGEGGWEKCIVLSHRGVIHLGCTPEKIRPATIDLWLSRATSNPPSVPPATAIIAAFTDNELPQVEKKAESAPTASAINASARERNFPRVSRSSSPPVASTSLRNGSLPNTARTRSSTPAPWRCPGGVKP